MARLNADLDAFDAIRADQDTQGVAGSPTIADVIFSKIDDCLVFLADITTVSEPGAARRMPNPNVMIEYGRATTKGDLRLIQIFNEAYGDWITERPFDLRHKRQPITYRLADKHTSEERVAALERLSKDLEHAIKLIVEAGPPGTTSVPDNSAFDKFREEYAAAILPEWTGRRLIGFWCGALGQRITFTVGSRTGEPRQIIPPLTSSRDAAVQRVGTSIACGRAPVAGRQSLSR